MSAQNFKNLSETIEKTADITKEQLAFLLATEDDAMIQDLKQRARNTGDRIYGKNVYIRGLIEFTNYCKNDCLYCGIRRSNCHADRYRLTEEEILSCCKNGYELGFCTFVLQGGEDGFYTDEKICQIVSNTTLFRSFKDKGRISRLCGDTFYRRKIKRELSGIF